MVHDSESSRDFILKTRRDYRYHSIQALILLYPMESATNSLSITSKKKQSSCSTKAKYISLTILNLVIAGTTLAVAIYTIMKDLNEGKTERIATLDPALDNRLKVTSTAPPNTANTSSSSMFTNPSSFTTTVTETQTHKEKGANFSLGCILGQIDTLAIEDVSGIAYSRRHRDVIYTINDKYDGNQIFAIDVNDAHLISTFTIEGAENNDWEDIAVGGCPDWPEPCIYILDQAVVYQVVEPASLENGTTLSLNVNGSLQYSWNEKPVETIMVDPDGEIYIVSKSDDGHGKIAHLPSTNTWSKVTQVLVTGTGSPLSLDSDSEGPESGDISPDGTEVLIKYRDHVYYWNTNGSRDYVATLTRKPTAKLPYIPEKKGRSICWDAEGYGYYTLSDGENMGLIYYTRF